MNKIMKKLLLFVFTCLSFTVNAQNSSFIPSYSTRDDLIMRDSFLIEEHRLYPTGIEFAEGKFLVEAGTRWVDLNLLKREIVCTTANAQGLVDHWEVHDVTGMPDKQRILIKVRYLTDRFPYSYRAGKLGMVIISHDSEMILKSISFFIADEGYSGSGETLYIYQFNQDLNR